jgi:hypothetical protein
VQQINRLGSTAEARQGDVGHISKEAAMAKGQQKKTKEVRKPKKEKPKTIAAAPSRGTVSDIKSR